MAVSACLQSRMRASRSGKGMPGAKCQSPVLSLPSAYPQPTLSCFPAWSPRCAAAACLQGHCSEHREHGGSEGSGSASQAKPAATSQAKPPGAAAPPGAGAELTQTQSSALSSARRGGKRGRETAQGTWLNDTCILPRPCAQFAVFSLSGFHEHEIGSALISYEC